MDKHGKQILKLIVGLINRQAEFYNVRKELTETQATMIAQTLIDEYGVENIEDVVLMFKMARAGNFGTIYGKLDGETIMGWMALYLDRKYAEMEKQHQNNKHHHTEIAQPVLEVIKQNIEQARPDQEQPQKMTIDRWREFFWQNVDGMPAEQLLNMKAMFEDMAVTSITNHYEKEIEKINEILK